MTEFLFLPTPGKLPKLGIYSKCAYVDFISRDYSSILQPPQTSASNFKLNMIDKLKLSECSIELKGLLNGVHMGGQNIYRALEGCQFILYNSLPCI